MKSVIETENYIYENGVYRSAFWIYIPYGRGLDIDTNEARALSRPPQLENCEVLTYQFFKNLSHSEWIAYLGDISKKGDVADELDAEHSNDGMRRNIAENYPRDLATYDSLRSDESATLPLYRWVMEVRANSLDKLDEQIQVIERDYKEGQYKNFTKWVILIPTISTTYKEIKAIFNENLGNDNKESNTGTHYSYSGLDFFETTTLQDRLGIPIGDDIYSSETIVGNRAKRSKVVIDFHRNIKRKAIIAFPKSMSLPEYRLSPTPIDPNGSIAPLASVVGQGIANQLIVEGQRVVHYNLNGYSYDRLENTNEFIDKPEFYQKIPIDQVLVNAMQPYGTKEQEAIFHETFKRKITLLFNISKNYTLTKSDIVLLEEATQEAFDEYWADNPIFRKLVGTKPELFVTISKVIEELSSKASVAQAQGNFERSDQLTDLRISLETSIGESRAFSRRTQFVMPDTAELVLDCYGKSEKMAVMQLVNTANFIVNELSEGDAIFIHGCDKVPPQVFKDYLNDELEIIAAQKKIRIFYLLDTTITTNATSIEDYEGVLYENFDRDFDIHIIGHIAPESFGKLELLFHNHFNDQMRTDMTTDSVDGRGMFRRYITKDCCMLDISEKILL